MKWCIMNAMLLCLKCIMPLYVHSMPGIVKHFVDTVESIASDNKNIPSPKVGFFVQSGFKDGGT